MYCEIPEFTRCCGCLPLRHGVLLLGYINVIYSSLNVIIYALSIENNYSISMVYHGATNDFNDDVCLAFFCIDLCFKTMLVYAAHRRNIMFLKASYYYALANLGAIILLEIIGIATSNLFVYYLEYIPIFLVGLGINLYFYLLIRSLARKLEMAGRSFENQLHQFVNGELKVDGNGVYPSAVLTSESV